MAKLYEDSRRDLITKSKHSDAYAPDNRQAGKNRQQRRLKSRIANSVKEFNKIDMNKLFKQDILDVNIRVNGETNVYLVQVSFNGFLNSLVGFMKEDFTEDDIDFKIIMKALLDAFNHNDVYVHCTCPDWCLEENTAIKLLNGEVITIKELLNRHLNNEELWVYSTDKNGDFKPGKVTDVWVSGYTSEMLKITLDNGKEIITTPSHKYMMRDGSYKKAEDLVIDDSLMPLYFSYHNGYECVKSNSEVTSKFYSVYKLVAKNLLQNEINEAKVRSNEDIIAIHHKDFNKLNNYPTNLFPMGRLEHWMYHANHVKESGSLDKFLQAGRDYWATEEAKIKQSKLCSEIISNWWKGLSDDEYTEFCKNISIKLNSPEVNKKLRASLKAVWENYTEEEYLARCEINRLNNIKSKDKRVKISKERWESYTEADRDRISLNISNGVKTSWKEHPEKYLTDKFKEARKNAFNYERTPEIEQQRQITKISNIIQKILDNNEIPSPETYEKYRTNGYPKFTRVFSDWTELSDYFSLNHKVKSIEHLNYDDPIPVYDLTIDKYNNFYVDAGVILHNCYRQAYWATVNGTNAGEPELRPSDETNPNDTKGAGCKHVNLVLNNNSWMMKVAAVINNYIKYIRTHQERLYQNVIYPAIFDKEYIPPEELESEVPDKDLLDADDYEDDDDILISDEDTIDTSNKWARTKTQFKPGNQSGIQFAPAKKSLDIDSIVDDTEE